MTSKKRVREQDKLSTSRRRLNQDISTNKKEFLKMGKGINVSYKHETNLSLNEDLGHLAPIK
tara:strand:+ start:45 stop:230 length:186 start_codon:yes stop_codon:yes gene_type:complete